MVRWHVLGLVRTAAGWHALSTDAKGVAYVQLTPFASVLRDVPPKSSGPHSGPYDHSELADISRWPKVESQTPGRVDTQDRCPDGWRVDCSALAGGMETRDRDGNAVIPTESPRLLSPRGA
jgi:hypothetical protein